MLEQGCSEIVSLINLSSEGFAPHWQEPVALLWIDGDHRYPGVRRDFELWAPYLTPEAVVVFDDALDPGLGPRRLIDELTASGRFEEVLVVGKIAAIRRRLVQLPAARVPERDLPFAQLIDWEFLRWNSYLSERYKLLYIATPKVACTSLKWWFAELEGYSEAIARRTDSGESDPDLIIHDSFHKVAPAVAGLPPEALAEPLASDRYFRFAVVRNPYRRIFSAWQSKILLREGLQAEPYLEFEFFQMPVQNRTDLAPAFEGFLEHLAAHEAPEFHDLHWTPQADLLQPGLIPYTSLSKIEDTKELTLELARHLGPDVPDPFAGQRKNESLIPYSPEFITARAAELLQELYAKDFQTFGYDPGPPDAQEKLSAVELEIALQSIAHIRGRNQRIFQIRGSLSSQIRNLEGQLAAQMQAVLERDGQIEHLNRVALEHAKRISDLDLLMHSLSSKLVEREQVIHALSSKIAEKELAVQSLASRAAETERELTQIKNSKTWRLRLRLLPPGGPLARMLRFPVSLLLRIDARRRLEQDRTLIISSGLFDADWYLAKNPDVAEANVEPARHYLLAGGFEGRDPGPQFSSNWYLDRYADVRDSGQNPLVHYIRYGRREGRAAHAAQY
jgi:hypothetical protein